MCLAQGHNTATPLDSESDALPLPNKIYSASLLIYINILMCMIEFYPYIHGDPTVNRDY